MSFFSKSGIDSPPFMERSGTFGPGELPSCMRSCVTIDLSGPRDAPGSTFGAGELPSCSCSSLTIELGVNRRGGEKRESARSRENCDDLVRHHVFHLHNFKLSRSDLRSLGDKLLRRHHRPTSGSYAEKVLRFRFPKSDNCNSDACTHLGQPIPGRGARLKVDQLRKSSPRYGFPSRCERLYDWQEAVARG